MLTILTTIAAIALFVTFALAILVIFVCLQTDSEVPLTDLHDDDMWLKKGLECRESKSA